MLSSPQKTMAVLRNPRIGNTGKNGILKPGSGRSLPALRRNAKIPTDTNINATSVPAEMSCARNSNGVTAPRMTATIVSTINELLGRCFLFNLPNHDGSRPSRPNE